MSNIIQKIKIVPNLYHMKGCTTKDIKEAQETLSMTFPDEYVDYVKEFGAISFYGTEWTGLGVSGYLNVVETTKQEREINPDFPSDCLVIENQRIDGLLTVMGENGKIYLLQYNKAEFLCDSLSEYLDICIARKKR